MRKAPASSARPLHNNAEPSVVHHLALKQETGSWLLMVCEAGIWKPLEFHHRYMLSGSNRMQGTKLKREKQSGFAISWRINIMLMNNIFAAPGLSNISIHEQNDYCLY